MKVGIVFDENDQRDELYKLGYAKKNIEDLFFFPVGYSCVESRSP